MLNDVRVAQSIQDAFAATKPTTPCPCEIKVLTCAYWPQTKPDDIFVTPDSLVQCQAAFERHYRRLNPTKQLKWQAERGMASLAIGFPKGSREVSASVYQAAVLIAIDAAAPPRGAAGIQINELSRIAGIPVADLKPLIASMLLAKGLNLVRVVGAPGGVNAKFTEADSVELNPDYSTAMRKLKLPTVSSAGQDTVAQVTIDASRTQMLDAAIVKVMKSRKTMKQAALVELVIQSVIKFFSPQPTQIKVRIEQLINKDFLERDADEPDLFKYLA
jgi:hypothetical protein